MTLLTIVHGIGDQIDGPRPSTVASNTNPEARQYLRIVNKVGARLMKVYPWNDLRKEHTFTAPGVETLIAFASMPSDFDRFVPETFWDRGLNNLLSGPISASEWAGLKVINYNIDNYKFTFRGGDVLSAPVVESGNACAFEYISNQWCQSSDSTGQTAFAADTDTAVLDEELITLAAVYDWLSSKGLDSAKAFDDFKDYFDTLQDNEGATENILVAADIFGRNTRHYDGTPRASRTMYYGDA